MRPPLREHAGRLIQTASLSRHTAIETGIDRFLVSLAEAGPFGRSPLRPGTRRAYGVDLDQFARFLHTRITAPTVANVPTEAVAAFARHLTDAGRSPRTVARKLAAVRRLFRFLCSQGVCPADPSTGVRGPRPSDDPAPLTPEEMRALLARPELGSFTGARNRALLELLYGAGLRLSEAVGLNLSHLGLADGRLRLTGPTPRAVPLGPQATEALQAYLLRRAEALLARSISSVDAGALFVSARGRRLHPRSIQRIVERYLRLLESPPTSTRTRTPRHRGPGQLRAACARHLVEAGADPGLVSALLDRRPAAPPDPSRHQDLSELTARYRRAHPRA